MTSEEPPTKMKRKYLKQAQRLMSMKANGHPNRKLHGSVEPFLVQDQHNCCVSRKGYHLDDTQCRCGAQYPVSSDPEIRDCCDLCTELKSMLKVQANVNKELKRLLVASVGSDFQHHLEQTVHEKAELSCELDAALQQSITSREDMDRISIDCDIWRSKFLASRLMIDELASWKAELSLKYEESQHALQCMLQERKQLSQVLLLAKTNLSKAIELHSTSFSGIKTEYSVKPLTISDVGHSLHAMSQTLCQQADDENVGANDLSTQACEPTVGELLAKQVLMSQLRIFKEKGFPLPRKLNSEDVHQHLVPNSCNTLLKHTIPSEHTPVPFCCKCKGKIMLI